MHLRVCDRACVQSKISDTLYAVSSPGVIGVAGSWVLRSFGVAGVTRVGSVDVFLAFGVGASVDADGFSKVLSLSCDLKSCSSILQ